MGVIFCLSNCVDLSMVISRLVPYLLLGVAGGRARGVTVLQHWLAGVAAENGAFA